MKNFLSFIKKIEKAAYPAAYRYIQDCESWDDLVDYCEAESNDDMVVLTGEEWYCLYVKSTGELVDLASINGISMKDLISIWNKISSDMSIIKLDARDGTSKKLINYLEKKGRIEVVSSESYDWAGETFWSMVVSIK